MITLSLIEGWTGVKAFLGRIAQWRVGIRWYAFVLGFLVALSGVAVALNLLLGAQPTPERVPALSDLVPTFLTVLILIGLGEEPAWRGFALPRPRRVPSTAES